MFSAFPFSLDDDLPVRGFAPEVAERRPNLLRGTGAVDQVGILNFRESSGIERRKSLSELVGHTVLAKGRYQRSNKPGGGHRRSEVSRSASRHMRIAAWASLCPSGKDLLVPKRKDLES